jgi:tellurite resistance-related uncharacterized protein
MNDVPGPARAGSPSSIPEGLAFYRRTPEFTQDTIPSGLLRAHATKEGVWGRICVSEGALVYRIVDPRRAGSETILTSGYAGVVEPTILHEVEPQGSTRFFVEFFR